MFFRLVMLLVGAAVGAPIILAGATEAQAGHVQRFCSSCGGRVASIIGVGDNCPHCGAVCVGVERVGATPGVASASLADLDFSSDPGWSSRYARRQESLARRDRTRQRLRKLTEEFRLRNDPEKRAAAYLELGQSYASKGMLIEAYGYYTLAMNVSRNADTQSEAEACATAVAGQMEVSRAELAAR